MTRRKRPAMVPAHADGPTPEQIAKGVYERGLVMHAETATGAAAHVATTGPVERWFADRRLTDTQMAAIGLVRGLWEIAGIRQKVTGTYGERLPACSNEWLAVREIDARHELHRIQDWFPPPYWEVFENCARFDEPAGVAGSRLGFGTRSARDRAHTVVCFVADFIAMKEGL